MKKFKIDILFCFKAIGMFIMIITVSYCQLTQKTEYIREEFWTFFVGAVTYVFMEFFPDLKKVGSSIKARMATWVRGFIALTFICLICYSTAVNLNIGKEFWSILGMVGAFLYGASQDISDV